MPKKNEIRCPSCNKMAAEAKGPTNIVVKCTRCKTEFEYSNIPRKSIVIEGNIGKKS